jgi:glucose-6-phosphate 1-dehydrogenase
MKPGSPAIRRPICGGVVDKQQVVLDGIVNAPCGEVSVERPAPVADSSTMVIFGGTGDLSRRKLLPALYNLNAERLLPDRFAVVAVGRAEMTTQAYREQVMKDLRAFSRADAENVTCEWLESRLEYLGGDFSEAALYSRIGDVLSALKRSGGTSGNCLFYLATPPSLFGPIVERLGAAGLLHETAGWRRVIVEKPFGHDLQSARALNRLLASVLQEHQIYRIDHYLGKETVQNIMALRFANGIFEPIWNRRYVDHVQITVAETVGVDQRGGYYDGIGALRDMVQNHLFQLLALTAMEPPVSFRAEAVRDERVKVLHAMRPMSSGNLDVHVVGGQYAGGAIDGTSVPGYRSEPKVAPDSTTETYVALRAMVDNWRWADVPFYLRTGKRLRRRLTEVVLQFKRAPLQLFRETPVEHVLANQLVLRIQPNEGIALHFQAKVPGPRVRLGPVRMDFSYADYFGLRPSTGYETLLYDAMTGDPTLFHRADIVEAGWSAVQPVLEAWDRHGAEIEMYPAGSAGPEAAAALIERDGRHWREPDEAPQQPRAGDLT